MNISFTSALTKGMSVRRGDGGANIHLATVDDNLPPAWCARSPSSSLIGATTIGCNTPADVILVGFSCLTTFVAVNAIAAKVSSLLSRFFHSTNAGTRSFFAAPSIILSASWAIMKADAAAFSLVTFLSGCRYRSNRRRVLRNSRGLRKAEGSSSVGWLISSLRRSLTARATSHIVGIKERIG